MLLIIYIISFVVGSIAALIAYKVRQRRLWKEQVEYINNNILALALHNIPEKTYVAMCTTFGKEKAHEMLINDWRIKNIH